jgi:uncharacterized protein YhaN
MLDEQDQESYKKAFEPYLQGTAEQYLYHLEDGEYETLFLHKSRAFLLVTAKVDGFYSQKQCFLHKLTG